MDFSVGVEGEGDMVERIGRWLTMESCDRIGIQSQLAVHHRFSKESAVGCKSALLELDVEEGDMGWIGMWMYVLYL